MDYAVPLLQISDLTVRFRQQGGYLKAVDGISLALGAGETLGVVGESGSGKSTLARSIIGLAPVSSGSIQLEGREITRLKGRARRALAGDIQYIFQDPYSSLNPTKPVGETLSEALLCRAEYSRRDKAQLITRMLDLVGMPSGTEDRYPRSFSGGQRQRIAIARALLPSPRIVICDEPTASLDLSIQAQILELFRSLQAEFGMSYLFIAHNLDVIRYMSDRTIVMCAGEIVEEGPSEAIATSPTQPYTRALIAATLLSDPAEQAQQRERRRELLASADGLAQL